MNITLTLNDQELGLIFQALGELPLKMSGPLFGKLQQQALQQTQQQAAQPHDHSDREL